MSGTIFKAILWKELRENLKWAVVILLGMATGLLFAMQSLADRLRGGGTIALNAAGGLEGNAAIGSIVAGLLLGAVQTIVESRGDKWGFLTHRPASRSTLFWGKATAGILLYAISTGVPITGALIWMATPGHLPMPFDWKIALPIIANLLGGLVFYFAAFLTGMREARWYATRALGVGAGICFFGLQMAAPAFWQAVAVCAAGMAVIGTAAWSTFVAGGQYGAQTRIGRAATGVSIGLGIALVGLIVFAISYPQFRPEPAREIVQTRYTVTTDGVVAKIVSKNGKTVEISDPNGRPLEQYRKFLGDQTLVEGRLNAGVFSVSLSLRPRWIPSLFRSTDRLFSLLRPAVDRRQIKWYYVHRLDLIAAYDIWTGNLIGWMGPDGFSPGNAKPRPFTGPPRIVNQWAQQQLLVLDDAVYRLDLNQQHVEKAFQPEQGEVLLDAYSRPQAVAVVTNGVATGDFDVISTTQRVVVQLHDGTKLLEARQDATTRRYSGLQVWRAMLAPGTPTFLWYQGQFGKESRIDEFNSSGAVVNSYTLPSTDLISRDQWPEAVISSAMAPLIGQAVIEFADRTLLADRTLSVEPSSPTPPKSVRWALAILLSLLSATAVLLRGRKYAFSPGRLHAWTWIGLLFGPLGYLTMLALIEWPAFESCPACSKRRVVTLDHCEYCHEPFAAPPQDGTEIFEPANWPTDVLSPASRLAT